MKTLIVLSVLQTIGIVALVVHGFRAEHPAVEAHAASPSAAAVAPAPMLDENLLRRIVREELALQHSRPAAEHVTAISEPTPTRSATAADIQRRDDIAQRIEAYVAVGAITDAQMMQLQADIAQLDPANRRQMMSRLVRSMNSGDLKGRL